jgi:hypothetical protein
MMRINECYDGCGVAFKITSQAAVAADPRKSSFNDPAFGQDLEAGTIGTRHYAQPTCPSAPDDKRHLLSGISAVSKYAYDEWKQSSRPTQQQQLERAVTVLDISGMDDHV